MSFIKKLFGMSSTSESGPDAVGDPVEHEGYLILATPMKDGGQFRLAATITKEIDGEVKEHKLIRADVFPSADDCSKFAVTKAQQVIKEQGDRMFS